MTNVTINTVPFAIELSANAYDTLNAAGWQGVKQAQKDVDALVNGKTVERLRAECLEGAEGDDVIAGWEEYVDAVEAAASR